MKLKHSEFFSLIDWNSIHVLERFFITGGEVRIEFIHCTVQAADFVRGNLYSCILLVYTTQILSKASGMISFSVSQQYAIKLTNAKITVNGAIS